MSCLSLFVFYINKIMSYELEFSILPAIESQYNSPMRGILKEIYILEIPTDYIYYIEVEFINGMVAKVESSELKNPFVLSPDKPNDSIKLKKISTIRIFLDLDKLENDVSSYVDALFDSITFRND